MDGTHTGKLSAESVRAALRRVRGSALNFVPRDCEAEARPADETAEAEQGQRSAFCKPAATGAAKAGNRNHQGEGISVPRMRAEMGSPWSVALLRHAERAAAKRTFSSSPLWGHFYALEAVASKSILPRLTSARTMVIIRLSPKLHCLPETGSARRTPSVSRAPVGVRLATGTKPSTPLSSSTKTPRWVTPEMMPARCSPM